METFMDYNRFRTSCSEFKEKFTEKYFAAGKLFCHPLCDGLIYTPCTPEEAKANTPDICRMSDMLLMSTDGEEFVPFKLTQAREIAAENGFIFISDLLFTECFKAADWMIDGKHDTLIVSEEHMKKEGRPYAPVTPLTNVVQHFRKFTSPFLYTKGTPESPAVLGANDISGKLDAYLDDTLSAFENLELAGNAEFEIFGTKAVIDANEARCAALDRGCSLSNELEQSMSGNIPAFKSAGYNFDLNAYKTKQLIKAAEKCGVTIAEKDFDGITEPEKIKAKFRELVSAKNSYGFKYAPADEKSFTAAMRSIEQSSASPEEIKKEIIPLLCRRPVSGAVFNLARAASPADAEAVENISIFWNSEGLSPADLAEYLSKAYIPAEARDPEGKLCCSGAEAQIISEEINTAAAKYKLKNAAVLQELSDYCEEFEKLSRTYNGTVFATKEEMEKAVANEKELTEICEDLSVLSEDELKKLRKYIYDMPLDRKTTGKYLLKIKLALNDCEVNQLKMLTTGLTLKKPEELAALKKKITEGGFDAVVAAPYIAQIDQGILTAQLAELTEMFKSIPDAARADSLEKSLESGKYSKLFTRHFSAKIADARDGFARKSLSDICAGIAAADKKALDDIKAKLDEVKCRTSLKAPFEKEISARYAAIEEKEVADVFANIVSADKAKVEELKKIIASGKYKAALTAKYAAALDERLVAIDNAEFTKKCDTIPQMDKKALDEIVAVLESGKYPESIVSKYMPMTKERAKALIKAEAAELCKDIAKMDIAALDALEAKLKDEKFTEDITAVHFTAIAERRKAVYKAQVDELCKNIAGMDKKALAELSEKLKNEKFDPEYTKKYYTDIDARFDKIEKDKLAEMCKNTDKLKKPELEKLSADIAALGFKKENTAPYLETIRKAEISLMKAELENLCKNIANTPRKELSKLKEALASGEFDKELSAKYIDQIDKRTDDLIKQELTELCKNIAAAPKDKLMSMKLTIADTPEYAEQGKPYVEQIDSRLKQLDKAEFDKQMASIEKLTAEELEKFEEDLEKRKPALDPKLYEASAAKCRDRKTFLDKQELDKLTAGIENAPVEKLLEIKEKITEGDFTPENTFPYLKKLDECISNSYVAYFTKLTEKMNGMSRAELIVLLEKINKNEVGCPDDMLQRYIGKVNSKIREADRAILDAKCKNLSGFSERRSFELIKDINDMDIDPADKKRYITQVELHITNVKTIERDAYTEKIGALMANNNLKSEFYVPNISKSFESIYIKIQNTYASTEQFELPVLIHEVTPGRPENSYLLTVDYLYYQGNNGFGHIAVDQIERFEAKKGLLGFTGINVIEKDGKSSPLPNGIDKKVMENAAKVLNAALADIQKNRAAANLREAEEIRAAEEAKLRELEEERLAIEAARKKVAEAEKVPAEIKPAEVKPTEAKPTEAKPAENKPAEVKPAETKPAENKPAEVKPAETKPAENKPAEVKSAETKSAENKPAEAKPAAAPVPAKPKPIEVVVSPIPQVKPIAPIADANKPADASAPAPAQASKPAEAPAPTQTPKPAAAPAPTQTPKPAEVPAKPVQRMKFCDQCGAKITSDTAKFCAECGNKLIK